MSDPLHIFKRGMGGLRDSRPTYDHLNSLLDTEGGQ